MPHSVEHCTSIASMKVALLCLALFAGSAGAAEVELNSLGMPFVRLPAGEFVMGSDESPESLARDDP